MRFDSCMHLGTHPYSQGTEEWLCFRELHKDLGGLLKHRSSTGPTLSFRLSMFWGRDLRLTSLAILGAIGPGPALWKSLIESVTIHPERSFLLASGNRGLVFLSSWLVSFFLDGMQMECTQNALFYVWLFFIRVMLWENHLVLLHAVYSYLLLSSVLLSEYSTVGLLILFKHICFSPSIGLSWIKFPWTFTYKSLVVTYFHHSWVNT